MKLFFHTYRFCKGNINKFIQVLGQGVFSFDYMDGWEKFNEILPKKEDFYGKLNMEDITDVDYKHVKRVWKVYN